VRLNLKGICTKYGVSVGRFKRFTIHRVSLCGFNWLNDIWCQCGWIQLVVRYRVSVWVDTTGCTIYGVSVGGFNWLYDIWCQCGWIQLVVGYMVQCDWIQLV